MSTTSRILFVCISWRVSVNCLMVLVNEKDITYLLLTHLLFTEVGYLASMIFFLSDVEQNIYTLTRVIEGEVIEGGGWNCPKFRLVKRKKYCVTHQIYLILMYEWFVQLYQCFWLYTYLTNYCSTWAGKFEENCNTFAGFCLMG